jgi:hypothetical protein
MKKESRKLVWMFVFFFSLLASFFNWGRIMMVYFFSQKKNKEKKRNKNSVWGVLNFWPTTPLPFFFFFFLFCIISK